MVYGVLQPELPGSPLAAKNRQLPILIAQHLKICSFKNPLIKVSFVHNISSVAEKICFWWRKKGKLWLHDAGFCTVLVKP